MQLCLVLEVVLVRKAKRLFIMMLTCISAFVLNGKDLADQLADEIMEKGL